MKQILLAVLLTAALFGCQTKKKSEAAPAAPADSAASMPPGLPSTPDSAAKIPESGEGFEAPPEGGKAVIEPMAADAATKARLMPAPADEARVFTTDADPDAAWWVAGDMNFYPPANRPRWSAMAANYPRKNGHGSSESAALYRATGGMVADIYNADPEGSINTCALRMSIALNKSGVLIPYKKDHSFKDAGGRYHILSAAKFFHYAMESFGKPDFYYEDANGFSWTRELDNEIVGKKGIYVVQAKSPKTFGATGHADLFDGQACLGGNCYFTPNGGAVRVALWVLKD